jgi:hypothetical protein
MGGGYWLLWQGTLLSACGPVVIGAQIACVIHVIRTGRPYWWIWIIFAFPLIGLAAYVYLEVRPALGKDWLHTLAWRLKSPRERIRLREAELAESTTVRNRLTLAEELHAAGQFDRECEVLAEGLRGAFKDDATLLMRLAEAHLEAGRTSQAAEALSKAVPEKSPDSQLQFALLQARLAAAAGRDGQAERQLQELIARRRSEGPRYYYAEFLLRRGRREEGIAILRDILQQYRRGTVVWRHQERAWFYAAKRLLKTPPAGSREPVPAAASVGAVGG